MSGLSGQPLLEEMEGFNFIPSDLTYICIIFLLFASACGVNLTLQPFGVVVCGWDIYL